MRYVFAAIIVFTLSKGNAQSELGSDAICAFCDSTFHYRKPIGGELERGEVERVIGYFADSTGAKSVQKCSDRFFKDGKQHGKEVAYYYTDEVFLVNWWGKPYKKPIKPWRKKLFASEMRYFRMRYKAFWQNGLEHGVWKYYNRHGKIVREETYKRGVLVNEKVYDR